MSCYSEEFQAMLGRLEEEDNAERNGLLIPSMMRKRKLSIDQVKSLEIYFEEDNKLDPERKMKIARELGLETRQVAVWFQNRRARYKAKHLEKDYEHLQACYHALKHDYHSLEQQRKALLAQLRDLREKVQAATGIANRIDLPYPYEAAGAKRDINLQETNILSDHSHNTFLDIERHLPRRHCEGNLEENDDDDDDDEYNDINLKSFASSSSSPLCERIDNNYRSSKGGRLGYDDEEYDQGQPYVKAAGDEEDHTLFCTDHGSCNFFSVDQPPTLHWQFIDDNQC